MQAVATASRAHWQGDDSFRPSRRESGAQDDHDGCRADEKSSGPSTLTIRQIRASMSTNPERQPPQPKSLVPAAPPQPKKKLSIFGGLFATKEPTQLALNQVTAQMIAQHGSTSATKVPNVRMERMPDFVPKVNSRWDGVPTNIKDREKREKDRQKALKRQSMMSNLSRPQSVGPSERRGRHQLSTGSSSGEHSLSSRGKSAHSHQSDPRSPNPHKFYAQSVNSSGDLASQQRKESGLDSSTVHSQSMRSSSISSLAPPMFITDAIPPPPAVPAVYHSEMAKPTNILSHGSRSSKASQPASSVGTAPPSDGIPEHTTSPTATPREGSPVTPSTQQAQEQFASVRASMISNPVSLRSSGPQVLDLPVAAKRRLQMQASEAFLAGEARPFELPDDDDDDAVPEIPSSDLLLRQWGGIRSGLRGKRAPELKSNGIDRVAQDLSDRPDSSRSRLGLKPSMLVRTEAAPWEGQRMSTLSPRSANARTRIEAGGSSPKRLLPSLGSLRKKES